MNIIFSKDLAFGPTGKLICAKRDRAGRIVLYSDAIALDYPDLRQGIKTYLRCFKDWNEDDHPRDEDGKWTDAGGSDGGGETSGGGGGTATSSASVSAYSKGTRSNHPGISSDFDIRPRQPMPSQSGIVTTAGLDRGKPIYRDIEVLINPTAKVVRDIAKEDAETPIGGGGARGGGARVLQDRAGNLFVWSASAAIHTNMMDALEPIETMWASDLFIVDDDNKGKLISTTVTGTDRVKEWVTRGQDNATAAKVTTVGFVSPNVKSDLDFTGAVNELKSEQQASLVSASGAIDRGLDIRAKEASVVGAWADGAENSVMMTAASDWDHGVVAMAMKGHLADQKSVLVFQQKDGGTAALSSFHATGKLADIHKNLLEDGLAFHTLVPSQGGATVYVADLDGSAFDAVKKGADRYDSGVTIQFGRAEFIGDARDDKDKGDDREQRDYARQVYERVIKESKVEGSAKVWSDIRDQWRQTASKEVTKDWNEDEHPRNEDGEWTDAGGGDGGGSSDYSSSDVGEGGGSGGSGSPTATVSSARGGVSRGSKIAKDKGIKPLTGSEGHPNLISTRLASAKGINQTIFRQPSVAAMQEHQANFDHDMALFKNVTAYPNLRSSETKGSSEQIARAVINHSKENLKFLYDNAPKETKEHGKFWYDGARVLVNEHVEKYKLNDASVTGVYAALSPQTLWDINVSLADRVIDIHQAQQNTPWSKEMTKTAKTIWTTDKNEKILSLVQGKKLSELKSSVDVKTGKTITAEAKKALWICTYDQAHNSPHYRSISPLGVRGDFMRTKPSPGKKEGKLATVRWQSIPAITNAVRSLEFNGDPAAISKSMGTQHKVRSFFNNILDPYSKNEDVTMDTHAVGAALLRPLSGSDTAVLHSMGLGPDKDKQPPNWEAASGSVKTGIQGLYGVYATAYRELAHELKIQPRQLQSITWEAKRKLFDRGLKETEAAGIEQAWQDYHVGEASLKDTQNKVVEIAGGFEPRD